MKGLDRRFLEVEIWRGERFPYVVLEDGQPIRSYDSLAAAWDHAIWQPLNEAGLVPVVGPGDTPGFASVNSRGSKTFWTDDPRFAQAVPREGASAESIERGRKAAARFIQRYLAANPLEPLEEEPVTDEKPENTPENPQDAAGEPDNAPVDDAPTDALEAVRERLSESEQRTFDNFRHMAESANTESARAWWAAQFEDFAGVPF